MEIFPIGCVQYSRCNQWMLSRKLANYGHTVSIQENQVNPKEVEAFADILPNFRRQPIFLGRHALILAKITS